MSPPATNRGFLARRLRSVRGRLTALVALAAVPLLLLAGAIVWQNYLLALQASDDAAIRLRAALAARADAGFESARHLLGMLGDMPALAGSGCGARLADVLALEPERYANFSVWTPDGRLRCAARPTTAVEQSAIAGLVAARGGAGALGDSTAAVVVRRDGDVLVAELRLGWFVAGDPRLPSGTAWLLDSHVARPLHSEPAAALALPAVLDGLRNSQVPLQAPSAGGERFAYAAVPLQPALWLLVACPTALDRARARMVLFARLGQLGLFLGIGLAAVGIGTHRALVQPIDRLERAVRQWQQGGCFAPDADASLPTEIETLTLAFSEAVASLDRQSAALRDAAAEQDLLMKEIHHRVKNNLQIIASLLNLQASRIHQPAAQAEFASARDRVRALATLHRHLYSQGTLTAIAMRPFLEELIGQLFEAMGERAGRRLHLSLEAGDLELGSDQAVPLALIVTEAVSNALKYAFPGGRAGHVAVRLGTAGGAAELVVEDDGVGMPAEPVETETGRRDGLGLQLIRGFTRQLGGTLEVRHDGGTSYRVSFRPESAKAAAA